MSVKAILMKDRSMVKSACTILGRLGHSYHKVLCDNIQVFSTAQRLQALRVPGSPPPSLSPSRTLAFVITNGVCRIFEFVASVFGSFKDIGIAFKAFPFVIYVFKTTVSL